ncbi:DUF411 domain-containing protein [Candidatus Woesearchaeota archaeon]|nr:DUF411 domain-containing protein [Candidatus Woesearchaeota archaeon]
MRKIIMIMGLIVLALLVVGCAKPASKFPETGIEIFKSPTCGCCSIYAKHMQDKGFDAKVTDTYDVQAIKTKYNVPAQLSSCHTTIAGDYFVEGHIPLEAVEKLLTEKPDIAGIAMPGMPSGSPGMPGAKQGQFVIFSVGKDGSINEFMRI